MKLRSPFLALSLVFLTSLYSNNDLNEKLQILNLELVNLAKNLTTEQVSDNVKTISWLPQETIVDLINTIEKNIAEDMWKEYQRNADVPEYLDEIFSTLASFVDYFQLQKGLEKRVKNAVEKSKDAFRKSLIPQSQDALNDLIPIINRTLNAALENSIQSFYQDSAMNWCPCTSTGARIYFLLLLLKDITAEYRNPIRRLSYISLGSGTLLQDYITLLELIHAGYDNFVFNFVELDFPDIPLLAKSEREQIDRIHQAYLDGKPSPEEMAQVIDLFKSKVAQEFSSNNITGKLEVNIYKSAYDYTPRAQRYPDQKSDILVLVDPGHGIFAEADYPSQANAFKILFDENNWLIGFLPSGQKPQLYEKINAPSDEITAKIDLVKKILDKANYVENYRSDIFKNLVQEDIVQETFDQIWQGYMDPKAEVPEQEMSILQIDPHITFQDVVRDSASDQAIIYTLTHPGVAEIPKPVPRKLNKARYLQEDVITKNNGYFYSQEYGFRRIL